MYKIQKNFIWRGKRAIIKHSTPCNGYEKGGIKYVALRNKITSTQCSCVKRLFEDDFHDWKVIPLLLISNFYKEIKWINNYTAKPTPPLLLLLLLLYCYYYYRYYYCFNIIIFIIIIIIIIIIYYWKVMPLF